jgi:rod shape determining protein RodA
MRPSSSVFPAIIILLAVLSLSTLGSIDASYGINQLLFFIGSLIIYWGVQSIPFGWFERTRWVWYLGVIALLVITLFIGRATNGAVSWIRLGSYRLQPSEFLKPVLFLFLASEATLFPPKRWQNIVRFGVLALVPLALVMFQPDLGTSLVILSGIGALFLAGGPPKKYIALASILAATTATIAWLFLFQPYQKARIMTFLSPTSDPLGSGYNAQQAMVAVGSGGVLGRGFGQGLQSHLRFLPERQTDFLFATFAEEAGLLSSLFLVSVYGCLFLSIAWLIRRIKERSVVLFTTGALAALMVQTGINIGMNIGIAPITGVTLPLFSLGGSSVLATALTLALLESARRSNLPAPRVVS